MKRALRSITVPAIVVAAGMFALSSPAKAGVAVGFYGPHVSVSVGLGPGPFYPGYVVPAPAAVVYRPYYGYGFWAPAGFGYPAPYWVPVHAYRSRWIVTPYGRSARYGAYGYAHGHGYAHR